MENNQVCSMIELSPLEVISSYNTDYISFRTWIHSDQYKKTVDVLNGLNHMLDYIVKKIKVNYVNLFPLRRSLILKLDWIFKHFKNC